MLLIVCSRIEACVFAVQTALRAGHHAHPYSALRAFHPTQTGIRILIHLDWNSPLSFLGRGRSNKHPYGNVYQVSSSNRRLERINFWRPLTLLQPWNRSGKRSSSAAGASRVFRLRIARRLGVVVPLCGRQIPTAERRPADADAARQHK
jgi:hypothetical protein